MSAAAEAPDVMPGAELRVVREWLGLTTRWLSDYLGVDERSIHRWESGERPVPPGVATAVEHLEATTAAVVDAAVTALQDARDPGLLTYRTDREYRQHHPHVGPDPVNGRSRTPWPASWHRAMCARAVHEIPGVDLAYWMPQAP